MERLSVFVQKVGKAVDGLSRFFGVFFILYLFADLWMLLNFNLMVPMAASGNFTSQAVLNAFSMLVFADALLKAVLVVALCMVILLNPLLTILVRWIRRWRASDE